MELTATNCSPPPGFLAWIGSTGHSAYVPPGGSFVYQEALAFWLNNGHVSFVVDANSGLDCHGSYTISEAVEVPDCDRQAEPTESYGNSDSRMVGLSPLPTLAEPFAETVCMAPTTTIPFNASFMLGLSGDATGGCDPSQCFAGGGIVCDPFPVSSVFNPRLNIGGACTPIVVKDPNFFNGTGYGDNVTVYVNGTLGDSFSFAACIDDNWDGACRPDLGDFIRFRSCTDPHPLAFEYNASYEGGPLIIFVMEGVSCLGLSAQGTIEGEVETARTDFAPRYNNAGQSQPPPAYSH